MTAIFKSTRLLNAADEYGESFGVPYQQELLLADSKTLAGKRRGLADVSKELLRRPACGSLYKIDVPTVFRLS